MSEKVFLPNIPNKNAKKSSNLNNDSLVLMREKKMEMIKATIAVVKHPNSLNELSKNAKKQILPVINKLPSELNISSKSKEVDRIVFNEFSRNSSIKLSKPNSLYTDEERREALFVVVTSQMSQAEAYHKYGVPGRTQREDAAQLRKSLEGENLTAKEFKVACCDPALHPNLCAAIKNLDFGKRGGKPLIEPLKLDVIKHVLNL